MDVNSSSEPSRGDTNIANIGNNAQVEQIAVGANITQIKGFTSEDVRVLLAEISTSYQPKPFDGRSPYVGLASFQEQDADRFFGREKLTQQLVARVETSRFVVIAGPSGSGKSSLARAGLIPALKRGALAGSERWLYETLAPGRHPLAELGRVVASLTKELKAGDDLEREGRTDATRLHRWLETALGDQRGRRAILLVDQFEETFTQVADESERAAFLNLLVYAATAENGRVTIVCATRSDFIGNWAAYPNLNAQLSYGVNQIPPMQPDELVSAIARPALQVGLRIDPELVKQILDDMRDAPGALPLMQFALQDLFEYARSKGGVLALTRDDYLERGGLQKALARHADAEFAKLNADEQQIARSIFAGLVEPGRGTVDTKRTALFQELVPAGSDPTQVKNVITKLADARLITTDEANQRETVMLAHERLIDAWAWLRRLVDENREAISLQNQIAEDAQEWEQHGRDASYLYAGARLATAQEQVGEKKIALSELPQEFVKEGRRRYRFTRIGVAAGVVIGTAIVVVIATLGITGSLNVLIFRPLPPDMVRIPAGDFIMGSTEEELAAVSKLCDVCPTTNESPDHRVYLDAYQINRYEVTNREYKQCENAGICDKLDHSQIEAENLGEYPVTDVSWIDAQKFCNWAGGRLPTEAEWEKAARGAFVNSNETRIYPWGNQWDPSRANADRGVEGKIAPVGSFPRGDSPYGVADMAGNASEWVADWYEEGYYANSPPKNPTGPNLDEKDPVAWRVRRGGSFGEGVIDARSTFRSSYAPRFSFPEIGFRCVYSAP